MENSISILEKEIERLQNVIKQAMISKGNFDRKLEILIGEHYAAIEKLEGRKKMTFYELKEPSSKNRLIEVGHRYASLDKEQEMMPNGLIFLHNWGIVERDRVENVTDICPDCGMPNKGACAKNWPNSTGWFICLCNWDWKASTVLGQSDFYKGKKQCQN